MEENVRIEMEKAAIEIALQKAEHGVIRIADLGCGDAVLAGGICERIINSLQKVRPELTIIVFLNDLPSVKLELAQYNFYCRIKHCIKSVGTKIFIYLASKSFCEQLFAESSIDLVLCMGAIQWLPSLPCPIETFFYFSLRSSREPSVSLWESACEFHYKHFVKLRALELAPHGHLIISSVGLKEILDEQDNKTIANYCCYQKALNNTLMKFGISEKISVPAFIPRVSTLIKYSKECGYEVLRAEIVETKIKSGHYSNEKIKISGLCRGLEQATKWILHPLLRNILSKYFPRTELSSRSENMLNEFYQNCIPDSMLSLMGNFQDTFSFYILHMMTYFNDNIFI